jgi:hypothetical protein
LEIEKTPPCYRANREPDNKGSYVLGAPPFLYKIFTSFKKNLRGDRGKKSYENSVIPVKNIYFFLKKT